MRNDKLITVYALMFVMASIFCSSCKTSSVQSKIPNRAILLVAGDVDSALVNRVQKFVETNYGIEIWTAHIQHFTGNTLESQIKEIKKLHSKTDMGIIALAAEPPEITAHGIVDSQSKCAIINVTALKPATTTKDWQEKYCRRVEKETIRAVGHLLGLPTCVNPRCAMSAYGNEDELDAKGRVLCPPCQHKAKQILGIKQE